MTAITAPRMRSILIKSHIGTSSGPFAFEVFEFTGVSSLMMNEPSVEGGDSVLVSCEKRGEEMNRPIQKNPIKREIVLFFVIVSQLPKILLDVEKILLIICHY
jgi:hypothetical protein